MVYWGIEPPPRDLDPPQHDAARPVVVDASLLQRLDRLRQHRVWHDRGRAVGGDVRALQAALGSQRRAMSSADRAWGVVPSALREQVESVALVRGVLKVRPNGAVARAELNRWLRAGGERQIIRAATTPVRAVRLVL